MQADWIKTRNSVKDEDTSDTLHGTKNEEAKQPEHRIVCHFCILIAL